MAPYDCQLPDDIMLDILNRLPIKSIGRCRCVSKQLQSLTFDPTFIQTHASLAPISGFIVSQYYFPMDGACEPSAISNDPTLSVVASCNGLVLLLHHSKEFSMNKSLFLCNPLTGKQHVIASPESTSFSNTFLLAFDPSTSPSTFKVVGFGKVAGVLKIHVYSSKTRSWKLLERVNVRCIKDNKGSAVFWKGCLVWLGWNSNNFRSCWDVEGEPLKLLSRPKKRCMHFGESGGRLYFVSKPRKGVALAVLMMESESSGWSLLYNVNLHPIKNMYPELRIHYRDLREKSTMFIVRGESKGDNQLMLSIRGLAISFHLQNKTFTTVRGGLLTGCIRMFPQKLTLYSVSF